eukprot:TRINITY_DN28228_c0_g2_i1.p1 TRINITY_DN28228_c0_g2~~TRINITY_DN28228_c0_g2_i1.p1  ORF type:complete len:356 (+),score=88.74 TRINITY_DN28228_c0_g2_i1:98-1069(+)
MQGCGLGLLCGGAAGACCVLHGGGRRALRRALRRAATALGRQYRTLGGEVVDEKCLLPQSTASALAVCQVQPVAPFHCVVAASREAGRARDLEQHEWSALWSVAQEVQSWAERRRGAQASTLLLKDGAAAGAPFPQLHVHVVPRVPGDFSSDQIFDALHAWTLPGAPRGTAPPLEVPPDSARRDRTEAEMAQEAAGYRQLLGARPREQALRFATYSIPGSCVFYESTPGLTAAAVNLRPLTPGHVLVMPARCVPRLADLSQPEHADLWLSVRTVAGAVEEFYQADGVEIGVQDGRDAGQSVPHVHVHIMPKFAPRPAAAGTSG